MTDTYPYMVSNNKMGPIFEKIKTAGRPLKFTNEFLKTIGFTSSNDRAIIPLLRRLGFITDDGTPTASYDKLKDSTQNKHVIAERMKDLYSDLYTVNENIHSASDEEIKGAISRITGKDAKLVNYYFATFKALASLAKFDGAPVVKKEKEKQEQPIEQSAFNPGVDSQVKPKTDFHYNIQIHLPATTDISVYNAIFKSLKDNLII
ncbi:DUF5343 domain-containing protein [Mucilaginibacter sp. RB4R14]|uniref:DUF5343 domain-containing protein n=1 Tax=Mucilaginibacter aurantiaciroseus TaxID=2949308 RepID=UPI0020919982|nr:DUF5343 domain-containing protein [Mucilaginibacter aurantiaciroseus]MCO5934267.1 DUF5343 domain-containing protein [Mucilaginibacter aurantiaciroseus]